MSEAERLVDEIHDKYAKYREENTDYPKFLVLSIEARQAIKIVFSHPYSSPMPDIKEFLGCQVIPREEVIIL